LKGRERDFFSMSPLQKQMYCIFIRSSRHIGLLTFTLFELRMILPYWRMGSRGQGNIFTFRVVSP
jgi:hypothetical protein